MNFSGLRVPAVLCITQSGEKFAQARNWHPIIEYSDRSESAYLHINRNGHWFGFRVACHEPAYRCSADYQQLLIPPYPSDSDVRWYVSFLQDSLMRGGHVVADPAEVQGQIAMAERRSFESHTKPEFLGLSWHWGRSEKLSALAKSHIRHRMNQLARWTYDECHKERS